MLKTVLGHGGAGAMPIGNTAGGKTNRLHGHETIHVCFHCRSADAKRPVQIVDPGKKTKESLIEKAEKERKFKKKNK